MDTSGDGSFGDLPTRPMRVKILYTFDGENKTTCLARFPDTLNIPVVPVDEQSQVGVIELQQCIQAVVTASPEILSKLEVGDFTVYSFDYTEHDTPIVGQGRLSSLLAASSGESKSMITGRVCKNIQALFSGGVKETLEVRFRLTPLAKPAQNEYGGQTDAYRSASPAMSSGFDPNAWNGSIQQSRVSQSTDDFFNLDMLNAGGNNGAAMLENMFGMGSGSSGDTSGFQQPGSVGMPETPTDSTFGFNPAFAAQIHSAPGSRAGSPIMHLGSSTHNEQLRHQSFSGQAANFAEPRPDSRASVRSESNTSRHQRQASTNYQQQQPALQQPEIFYNEDGQARKRARVTQTDWRGKSSFGTKSADLRVTAATASSMHMFRPIAKRPTAPGADLEPPPRVPTPVPKRTMLPRPFRQLSAGPRSTLRQGSTVDSDFMSDVEPMSDAMSSPDGSSPGNSITAEGTPMDIPSSPPLIPGFNQPMPSSPGLPTHPYSRVADSGYMSGAVMESLEDDESRSPDADDVEMTAQYRARSLWSEPIIKTEGCTTGDLPVFPSEQSQGGFSVQFEQPGDMNLLPTKSRLNLPPGRVRAAQGLPPKSASASTLPANKSVGPRHMSPTPADYRPPQTEASTSRRGSLALPKLLPRAPSYDQGSYAIEKQKRRPLQRSQTTYNDSEAGSPAPSDTEGRPRGPTRSGSGAPRRKKLIEQRLQEAIARGDAPVFCVNCGAIETPTWRKIYVKTVYGKPGPLDHAEGENETIGIENLETDDNNVVSKFLIRKSMKKTKEFQPGQGFEDTTVCNPCGLWFNKFRQMRPEEKWHRKHPKKTKKSRNDDGLATDGMEPQSEAFFTDQITHEDAMDEGNSPHDTQSQAKNTSEGLLRQVRRPRANSLQPQPPNRSGQGSNVRNSRGGACFMRETQSSPAGFGNSQEAPIELDLTPQPTRRLLFPSPRQHGHVKSLHEVQTQKSASSSGANPTEEQLLSKMTPPGQSNNLSIFEAFTFEKENMAPPIDDNADDLSHLFDGSPSAEFKTPLRKPSAQKTPRSQRLFADLLKTPTQSSRKRKALAESLNAANGANPNLNRTPNDFMTSPSSARYFLRSTPSRLDRTPGGRSVSVSGSGVRNRLLDGTSPFSRHLAQMLNEASDLPASDGGALLTSPSRTFDFGDCPSFATPGREVDWKGLDDILSSEFVGFEGEEGLEGRDGVLDSGAATADAGV